MKKHKTNLSLLFLSFTFLLTGCSHLPTLFSNYESYENNYHVTKSAFDSDSYSTVESTDPSHSYVQNNTAYYPSEYQTEAFQDVSNKHLEYNTIDIIGSFPITRVFASSSLGAQGSHTYTSNLSIDKDETTAWIEGSDGLGIGEWIQFELDDAQTIVEISLFNGYGGNFENNGIISTIRFDFSNGETQTYDLVPKWNMITLSDPVITNSVKMTILDATTNKYDDTGISEVFIYGKYFESSITPEQASAFQTVIYDLEEKMEQEVDSNYLIHAELFDGGDGIPVLFLSASTENSEGFIPYITEIWQWENGSLTQPDFGDYLYPMGLAQKDDQYYLILDTLPTGTQYNVSVTAMMGFESGIMSSKPATLVSYLMAIDAERNVDTSKFEFAKDDLILQYIPFHLYEEYMGQNPTLPSLFLYDDTIFYESDAILLVDNKLQEEYTFIRCTLINEPSETIYHGNYWHTATDILYALENISP